MADLIDRPELRKAMYHEAFETDSDDQMWDSGCWIRYKMFERILDSMPPAERKGKWIYLDGLNIFECSSCGGQMVRNVFHYCPWCGAKMEPCAKRGAPMTVCPMCPDCPDNCPLEADMREESDNG